jgi:hypothetical protein
MSAGRGGPRPLLMILQRGSRPPDAIARPEQNPTEVFGVDALVDAGG